MIKVKDPIERQITVDPKKKRSQINDPQPKGRLLKFRYLVQK